MKPMVGLIKVRKYSFYLLDPNVNKVEVMGLLSASILYIQIE